VWSGIFLPTRQGNLRPLVEVEDSSETLICVFISVFNQLDAQNLFHNKFYFMPIGVMIPEAV